MAIVLLQVFVLVALCFAHGLTINCYSRTGTASNNGSVVACAGYTHCYTYGSPFITSYAGCSTGASCPVTFGSTNYGSCVTCTTDYCNTMTPSSISCYKDGSTFSNGTQQTCQAGINSCYSWAVSIGSVYSGCGTCITSAFPSCVTCSTNYCNTVTPSSISCYRRFTQYLSDSPGTPELCLTGITSCYSYTAKALVQSTILVTVPFYVAGCGTCSSSANASCVVCNTDNCNTMIPSSISCYYRHEVSSNSNGDVTPCSTGISSCNAYSIGSLSYGGCGVCSASTLSSGCTSCRTNNCNINRNSELVASRNIGTSDVAGVSMKITAAGVMLLALMNFMI